MKLIARDTKTKRKRANAVIAQSVERVIGNDEVGSSNLPNSSKILDITSGIFFFRWTIMPMLLYEGGIHEF